MLQQEDKTAKSGSICKTFFCCNVHKQWIYCYLSSTESMIRKHVSGMYYINYINLSMPREIIKLIIYNTKQEYEIQQ